EHATPVLLSKSITTNNVKEIHELLQSSKYSSACLEVAFEYKQSSSPNIPAFKAILKLQDRRTHEPVKEIETQQFYPSKKGAKEEAARLGVEFVNNLPEELSNRFSEVESNASDSVSSEWIGKLAEFCQKKNVMPEYRIYEVTTALGSLFSCEVALPAKINIPKIEGKVFGDRSRTFSKKKTARASAARETMEWLNSQTAVSHPSPPPTSISVPEAVITAGARLNYLCPKLDLSTPEYHVNMDPDCKFFEGYVLIKRLKGGKSVKVGPMKNMIGKKAAREKLANAALKWLNREAERLGI
ncbi:hypothetical protein EDC01DRAFT_597122, partial [Geopyxis carbonaria]